MKRRDTLTLKQKQVLAFIEQSLTNRGFAPSQSELAKEMDVKSPRSISQYLDSLQRKGFIKRSRYENRGISLTEDNNTAETIQVPVFASAGCGDLSIIADRVPDEFISVSSDLINGRKGVYVIKAIGNSLADAGIKDGDFVLVERTENVQANDLVVAIIDDNAVIKKLTFSKTAVILEPVTKDPSYKPIIMQRDFKVFGKVIDIIKIERSEEPEIVPFSEQS